MAAFLARAGTACRFHRASLLCQASKIPRRTNYQAILLSNGQICSRNFATARGNGTPCLEKLRSLGTKGVHCRRNGSIPWGLQSARCFSGSVTTSSGELLQDTQSTNPFLQESASESLVDTMGTNSEMVKDLADAVTAVAEPSLASLGLVGYSPIGLILQSLDFLHASTNLSWFASIAVVTIAIRVLCFPLIVKAQANTAKLNNIKPQLEELQAKLRELANSHDEVAKGMASLKMKQLYKDHDCHPFKSILTPLVQIPLFISFFIGIRRMANLPVESLKTGGFLWFQDLTMFDPYFVLPIVCSFSMLASLELGTELGVNNPAMKTMKNVMRVISLATIPITAQFPAAIFAYWITSNFFTIGQVALMKIPAVRKMMGIPEMVKYETGESGKFWENLKAGYKNAEESAKIKHMEKMKRQRQIAMGEAPLEQTYDFNPRIKHNQEIFGIQGKKNKKRSFKDKPGATM